LIGIAFSDYLSHVFFSLFVKCSLTVNVSETNTRSLSFFQVTYQNNKITKRRYHCRRGSAPVGSGSDASRQRDERRQCRRHDYRPGPETASECSDVWRSLASHPGTWLLATIYRSSAEIGEPPGCRSKYQSSKQSKSSQSVIIVFTSKTTSRCNHLATV